MMILWHLAAILSGSSVGLLGSYLVGFRMPFLAIALSHAAMAGGILACLLGWPVMPVALLAALLAGGFLAWLTSRPVHTDLNTATSLLLSLTLGLAFLGMGLNRGDMTPMLSLLWGNLLLVRLFDILLLALSGLVLLGGVVLYRKELEALLFSRRVARASGIRDRHVMMVFLVLAAAVVTVNISIVGGLLMYALLTNPAAAAYELAHSIRTVRMLSLILGVCSTLAGFWVSFLLDLPTGACIVLISCIIYGFAAAIAHLRWR